MKRIVLSSIVASTVLLAGGYKIPENSANALALGAANVAHNHNSADAAFYNPAKMVFMSDENHIDVNLMYVGLDNISYKSTDGSVDESSESENFIIPSFHYVSEKFDNSRARVGVSIVSPGGLSKRWDGTLGSQKAKEFTLQTVEVNPTAAFEISKDFGFAVGLRIVHSKGIVKNAYYDMEGDGLDFGYNLALAYQPVKELEIGITYRSKIDLNLDGDTSRVVAGLTNSDASVSVPLPGALNVALAYTLPTETTIEFVYERTYWSAYSELDFDFTDPVTNVVLGNPIEKDWSDSSSYRLGVTQKLDTLTLMGGVVIDESPVPEKTLGFELPDTDSVALSLGARYAIDKNIDIALSALYSMHDERDVKNSSLDGEFSGGDVLMISAGVGYRF